MTPKQLSEARKSLGLTLENLAFVLGYRGTRQIAYDLESGRRTIREPQRRLMEAYIAGYRPKDWPVRSDEKSK